MARPAAASPTTTALLQELRLPGQVDSHGRFTLDRARAREKMRLYQLLDPRHYVLNLVQAAIAGGASEIRIQTAYRTLFDARGWAVPPEVLEQPLGGLFLASDRLDLAAWRELAIALNAVAALHPRSVTLSYNARSVRVLGERVRFVTAPPDLDVGWVRIEVVEGWLNGVRRWWGAHNPEAGVVQEKTRFSPVSIELNGQRWGDAAWRRQLTRPDVALATTSFQHPLCNGALWALKPGIRSSIRFVKLGVEIGEVVRDDFGLPCFGIIAADTLNHNLSGTGIVEDDRLEEVLQVLRTTVAGPLLEKLLVEYAKAQPEEAAMLRSMFLEMAILYRTALGTDRRPPGLDRLFRTPLLPMHTNEQLSLDEVATRLRLTGGILYWYDKEIVYNVKTLLTTGRAELPPVADPRDDKWPNIKRHNNGLTLLPILRKLFEDVRYGEKFLLEAARRVSNRKRLQVLNKGRTTLVEDQMLVVVPADLSDVEGEIGLLRDDVPRRGMVDFYRNDGWTVTLRLDVADALGAQAILATESLRPTFRYDDIERDDAFTRIESLIVRRAASALNVAARLLDPTHALSSSLQSRLIDYAVYRIEREAATTSDVLASLSRAAVRFPVHTSGLSLREVLLMARRKLPLRHDLLQEPRLHRLIESVRVLAPVDTTPLEVAAEAPAVPAPADAAPSDPAPAVAPMPRRALPVPGRQKDVSSIARRLLQSDTLWNGTPTRVPPAAVQVAYTLAEGRELFVLDEERTTLLIRGRHPSIALLESDITSAPIYIGSLLFSTLCPTATPSQAAHAFQHLLDVRGQGSGIRGQEISRRLRGRL